METILQRKEFLSALQSAKPALSTKGFVPLLGYFCLSDDEVLASNDSQCISVRVDLNGLKAVVPGEVLVRFLASAKGESDQLKVTIDGNEINFRSGASRIKLPYIAPKDYPFQVPTDGKEESFPINVDFLSGIETLIPYMGLNVQNPVFSGVTVTDQIMYASDSSTITRFLLKQRTRQDAPVVLPGEFCRHLVSLSKDFGSPELTASLYKGAFTVNFGSYCSATTRLPAAEVPNFEARLKEYTDVDIVWDSAKEIPAALDESIDRVCIPLTLSDSQAIDIEISEESIRMRSKGSAGEGFERVPFVKTKERTFRVTPDLFKRALRDCTRIYFTDKLLVTCTQRLTHVLGYLQNGK